MYVYILLRIRIVDFVVLLETVVAILHIYCIILSAEQC